MKILHVINVRWFNATAWYGLYLARLQQQAGHQVLVVALPGTAPADKARGWSVPLVELDLNAKNPTAYPRLLWDMHRLVQNFSPDVVTCHRGEAFILWGALKKLHKFRLVRVRGDQRPPKNNIFNRVLHKDIADAVVITNSAIAASFREQLGVPASQLHRIYGGVDTHTFRFDPQGRQRVRKEFGCTDDTLVLGLLGRFDTVKAQEEAIAATARLHQLGHTHVRLLLLGHDSALTTGQVEQWIAAHEAGAFVSISGHRNDVAACLSACDIGLVPSKWSETIARAALEFMACTRPVLSSRVGVMPDLVPEFGLFAPPAMGDMDEMLQVLGKAITEPEFVQQVLEDEQRRMPQLTGEAFVRQTELLYESIMD